MVDGLPMIRAVTNHAKRSSIIVVDPRRGEEGDQAKGCLDDEDPGCFGGQQDLFKMRRMGGGICKITNLLKKRR